MVIHGDFEQSDEGHLEVEIGGTEAGDEYDQLQVVGTAYLNGRLDVVLADGFMPRAGDIFDIVHCRACLQHFDEVTLPALPGGLTWDVRYEHHSVRLFVVLNGAHP
jgi:hypothetical protein